MNRGSMWLKGIAVILSGALIWTAPGLGIYEALARGIAAKNAPTNFGRGSPLVSFYGGRISLPKVIRSGGMFLSPSSVSNGKLQYISLEPDQVRKMRIEPIPWTVEELAAAEGQVEEIWARAQQDTVAAELNELEQETPGFRGMVELMVAQQEGQRKGAELGEFIQASAAVFDHNLRGSQESYSTAIRADGVGEGEKAPEGAPEARPVPRPRAVSPILLKEAADRVIALDARIEKVAFLYRGPKGRLAGPNVVEIYLKSSVADSLEVAEVREIVQEAIAAETDLNWLKSPSVGVYTLEEIRSQMIVFWADSIGSRTEKSIILARLEEFKSTPDTPQPVLAFLEKLQFAVDRAPDGGKFQEYRKELTEKLWPVIRFAKTLEQLESEFDKRIEEFIASLPPQSDSSGSRVRDGQKGMALIVPLAVLGAALTALAVAVPLSAADGIVAPVWLSGINIWSAIAGVSAATIIGMLYFKNQEQSYHSGGWWDHEAYGSSRGDLSQFLEEFLVVVFGVLFVGLVGASLITYAVAMQGALAPHLIALPLALGAVGLWSGVRFSQKRFPQEYPRKAYQAIGLFGGAAIGLAVAALASASIPSLGAALPFLAGLAVLPQGDSDPSKSPDPFLHSRIVEGLKQGGLNPEALVTDVRKLREEGIETSLLERGWKKENSSQEGRRIYSLGDADVFKWGQRVTYIPDRPVYLTTFAGPVMQIIAMDSSGNVVFNEIHRLDRGGIGSAKALLSSLGQDVLPQAASKLSSTPAAFSSEEALARQMRSWSRAVREVMYVNLQGYPLSVKPNGSRAFWYFTDDLTGWGRARYARRAAGDILRGNLGSGRLPVEKLQRFAHGIFDKDIVWQEITAEDKREIQRAANDFLSLLEPFSELSLGVFNGIGRETKTLEGQVFFLRPGQALSFGVGESDSEKLGAPVVESPDRDAARIDFMVEKRFTNRLDMDYAFFQTFSAPARASEGSYKVRFSGGGDLPGFSFEIRVEKLKETIPVEESFGSWLSRKFGKWSYLKASSLALLGLAASAGLLGLRSPSLLPTWGFVLFSLGVFLSSAVFSASVAFWLVRWVNRELFKGIFRKENPDLPFPSDEEIDSLDSKGWAISAAIAGFFVGGYLVLSYFMYLFSSLFAAPSVGIVLPAAAFSGMSVQMAGFEGDDSVFLWLMLLGIPALLGYAGKRIGESLYNGNEKSKRDFYKTGGAIWGALLGILVAWIAVGSSSGPNPLP